MGGNSKRTSRKEEKAKEKKQITDYRQSEEARKNDRKEVHKKTVMENLGLEGLAEGLEEG